MADLTLDGIGGGEITIANGDRITKCDGPGNWVVWAEDDGQELVILDRKDGDGSLELHGFGSITIQNKKDGTGSLIVDADCGSFSVHEINGPGQTYLRNSGSKHIDTKDGDGNIYFTGRPPVIGNKNGNGGVIREGAGFVASAAVTGLVAGAGAILFDQTWDFRVLWMDSSIELRITANGGGLLFRIAATIAGNTAAIDLPVSGDQSFDVPVYLGSIGVGVSGWSLTPNQIAFDLTLRYVPSLPYMPAIPITSQRIVLSRPSFAARLSAPANLSATDLLALAQLQQLGAPGALPSRKLLAEADLPPGVQLIAGATYDFGPNWREDHLVDPSAFSGRGGVRYGDAEVYLQPGGNGHAEFLRWYSSDPTDLRFYFHVGSPFFGGGGRVIWNVYGTPQPWADAKGSAGAATTRASNGAGSREDAPATTA